jgi:NNP family nitrate/nitrite transporter-like MFS transporter
MRDAHTAVPDGNAPTLAASFFHFAVTTMLWVLIGALAIYIADDLALSPAQKGLLVGAPILSGSLLRVPLGLLGDRIGAKRVGMGILFFVLLPLCAAWQGGNSLGAMLAIGLALGVAGSSFAVAIPLASRWYPPRRQGLVLGLTGAGTCFSTFSYLFAPRLAERFGWHAVFGWALIPLLAVTALFLLVAEERPGVAAARSAAEYLGVLRQGDLWVLGFVYAITFGGMVGLGSFLPVLLRDQYHVSPTTAGALAAAAALAAGAIRPVGGYFADRFGGARLLSALVPAIALVYLAASSIPSLGAMGILVFVAMICMGLGNGSVFQLVPGRFPGQIGIATGVVGALGGLGGFALPVVLGTLRQARGSFAPGFLALAVACAIAAVLQRVRISAPHAASRPAPEALLASGVIFSASGEGATHVG